MWGSHNDINNLANAKWGSAKLDNTPKIFNVNGKRWEIYFGPSDQATRLGLLIDNEPNKSINFAILSYTLFTIANKMKAKYNPPSLMVRGVFDQANVSNNLYLEMKGIGGSSPWNPPAKVFLENYYGAQMHSKYTVIDADLLSSNPGQIIATKGKGTLRVDCKKPGYTQQNMGIAQTINGVTFVNVLFWPGFIIDAVTGNMHKYPSNVTIQMKKQ